MADISKRAADIRKKQMMVLGAVGAAVAVISVGAAAWLQPDKKHINPADQPKTRQLMLSGASTDKEAWRVQSAAELEKMARRLQELERFKADQEEREKREKDAKAKDHPVPPPQPAAASGPVVAPPAPPQPKGNGADFFTQVGNGAPPPPTRPGGGPVPAGVQPEEPKNRISSITLEQPPNPDEKIGAPLVHSARRFGQEEAERRGEKPSLDGKERYYDDDPLTPNRAAGRTAETYLPAGTFARAVLLNGLDAPTGGQAQQNPHPVLLRLVDNAQLPNTFKANLKNCFITGNGHGDISSERAYIRLDRLSCIDEEGGAVDVALRGYISGEDGKTGLRGRLVTKTGQVLANAIFTGVLGGLGEAIRQSAVTTTTATATGAQTQTVDNALQYGLGGGMGKAMDRVAQYYIKLAEKMFPVIEVDAGRVVDIVITRGVTIERK